MILILHPASHHRINTKSEHPALLLSEFGVDCAMASHMWSLCLGSTRDSGFWTFKFWLKRLQRNYWSNDMTSPSMYPCGPTNSLLHWSSMAVHDNEMPTRTSNRIGKEHNQRASPAQEKGCCSHTQRNRLELPCCHALAPTCHVCRLVLQVIQGWFAQMLQARSERFLGNTWEEDHLSLGVQYLGVIIYLI